MAKIVVAEDYFRVSFEDYLKTSVNPWRIKNGLNVIREVIVADHEPIKAIVNSGRWLARCPFCAGAERVFESNPVFLCMSCHNKGTAHIKVEFPEERKEIEAILIKRPDPATRNWEPGETIEFLQQENIEHGLD